jgi:hypothetical protein
MSARPEIEHHPVDAITQMGGRRTVVKDMAKMGFAAPAFHFGSFHAMSMIRQIDDAALADGLVKAWPAASAFEFGIASEQGIAAYGAIIGPYFLRAFEGAAPGSFGALHTGDVIDLGRQYHFPFLIGQIDRGAVLMGIIRVMFFFSSIHIVQFQLIGCW